MKETEIQWLYRNRKRINKTEMARYIWMNQGNLTKCINAMEISEKYIDKVKQYIKLFEVKEMDHPDININ